jgi:hypothetical protein
MGCDESSMTKGYLTIGRQKTGDIRRKILKMKDNNYI